MTDVVRPFEFFLSRSAAALGGGLHPKFWCRKEADQGYSFRREIEPRFQVDGIFPLCMSTFLCCPIHRWGFAVKNLNFPSPSKPLLFCLFRSLRNTVGVVRISSFTVVKFTNGFDCQIIAAGSRVARREPSVMRIHSGSMAQWFKSVHPYSMWYEHPPTSCGGNTAEKSSPRCLSFLAPSKTGRLVSCTSSCCPPESPLYLPALRHPTSSSLVSL